MTASGSGSHRAITIYRARDAEDLGDTDFMTRGERSEATTAGITRTVAAGAGAGAQARVLVRDAGGFSLVHLWLKPNYPLPRHTHDVDCMYYVVSGRAVMGRQTLRPGDSFFVPAGAPYQYSGGPEGVEVLEVRHGVGSFDIDLLDVSSARWAAMAEIAAANHDAWERAALSPTFEANRA